MNGWVMPTVTRTAATFPAPVIGMSLAIPAASWSGIASGVEWLPDSVVGAEPQSVPAQGVIAIDAVVPADEVERVPRAVFVARRDVRLVRRHDVDGVAIPGVARDPRGAVALGLVVEAAADRHGGAGVVQVGLDAVGTRVDLAAATLARSAAGDPRAGERTPAAATGPARGNPCRRAPRNAGDAGALPTRGYSGRRGIAARV